MADSVGLRSYSPPMSGYVVLGGGFSGVFKIQNYIPGEVPVGPLVGEDHHVRNQAASAMGRLGTLRGREREQLPHPVQEEV